MASAWLKRRFLAKDAGLGRRQTRVAGGTIPAYSLVKLSGNTIVVAGNGDAAVHGVSVESTEMLVNADVVVALDSEIFANADVTVNAGEAAKAYANGTVGPILDTDFVGDTIKASTGLSFANQPANDGIEVVSSSALDVQTVRVWGTTNGGVVVVYEDVVLTGTTFVATVKVDWGLALGFEIISGGAAIGTLTFREASGNATIITIAPGGSSSGVATISGDAQRIFNRIPTVVAGGASTKVVGLVGTDANGVAMKQAVALNGTTKAAFASAMRTATKMLVGDVATATTATAKLNTVPDSPLLKVGYVLDDADEGGLFTLIFDNPDQIVDSQLPATGAHVKKFVYSFALSGGAQGVINMLDENGLDAVLPADSCLIAAYTETSTAMVSGGSATIKIGLTGDDDAFSTSLAYNNAAYALDKFGNANATLPIKITSEQRATFTITTADLSAGVVNLWVRYFAGQ